MTCEFVSTLFPDDFENGLAVWKFAGLQFRIDFLAIHGDLKSTSA